MTILEAELKSVGLELPAAEREFLTQYISELERWSLKMNLTALRGSELIRRLILEPVWIGEHLGISGRSLDIGSGNGSPGIPLHISRKLEATFLVESRSKRSAFLRHVCMAAGLSRIEVICDRFEKVAAKLTVPVDWITLQGVRFDQALLEVIKTCPHERLNIAWITSAATDSFPIPPTESLAVPFTSTLVHLFKLGD